MFRKAQLVVKVCTACALWATPAVRGVDDVTWNSAASDVITNTSRWTPARVPGTNDYAHLLNYGAGSPYTVTVDVDWDVHDLEVQQNATLRVDGHYVRLDSAHTMSLKGTLRLANGTVYEPVNTSSTSQILGYGTIDSNLSSNSGVIRAENGQLTIGLASNSHNSGTLAAAAGGTLYIRNAADITNGDTISPVGGTIKGYLYALYTLYNGVSSTGNLISGYGTIDRYYVRNNGPSGGVGTIRPSGGTLVLNQGFRDGQNAGIVEVPAGATLSLGNNTWINYGTVTMTGGGITGPSMSQNATMNVTAGSGNTIDNISFYNNATIGGGATLTVTGTGTLYGATLVKSGTGFLNVGNGALVQGRGTINPDVGVAGTLAANSGGNTLVVNGALNVQSGRAAYAGGGGTLDLNGTVTNGGSVYANGGNITVDGAITNTGSVYAMGSGSSLMCSNAVYNRGSVYASSSGATAITGTIKAGTLETGDFYATSATLNIGGGSAESGVRNTFTANAGGTIMLWSNPSTASLFVAEAIRPRGGTITIGSGQTLTNAVGKTIKGYGTLLAGSCSLTNDAGAMIEADGGALTVNGGVGNAGTMQAVGAGDTLTIAGVLTAAAGSTVRAANGATVNLNNSIANAGSVEADSGTVSIAGTIVAAAGSTGNFTATGSGAQLTVSGTVQAGCRNTFTANNGGTITLPGNFTTGDLYASEALRPRGGAVTIHSGTTLTNAGGKMIRGFGALLGSGLTLLNEGAGTVEADLGVLTIGADVTNRGVMRAIGGGDQLVVQGRTVIEAGGQVYADGGGAVMLAGLPTHHGTVSVGASGGTIVVLEAAPVGGGEFVCSGGTIQFASGFSNAGLTRVNALRLSGGSMTVASGELQNAVGKRISGFGTLLNPGQSLANGGEILAEGGTLRVQGDSVKNTGLMQARNMDTLEISGAVNNQGGIIRSTDGALIRLSGVTGGGTIEILAGGGTGHVTCSGTAGGGAAGTQASVYRLHQGRMTFAGGLSMSPVDRIDDDQAAGSIIEVSKSLRKLAGTAGFNADHIEMRLFNVTTITPTPQPVDWQAQDLGAVVQGLDGNLTLGHLVFGDGAGGARSDLFVLGPETTIYCYGLTMQSDADVDLGGRVIYYLRDGLTHNGIAGTGFENLGQYTNGEIIEIRGGTADFDTDGDVDLSDFGRFQSCYNGPNRPPAQPRCEPADFDGDLDVDLIDFGTFQSCFNGPNRPPAPGCP